MPIGIIASSAGAAQHLSLLPQNEKQEYLYCLEGSAVKVFRENSKKVKSIPVMELIQKSREILIGRSWETNLGLTAIKLAKQKSKKVSIVLDHWSFSRQEFDLWGEIVLPDQFIVFDQFAYSEAKKVFPNTPIVCYPNLYLTKMKSDYEKLNSIPKNNQILYLAEPIDLHNKVNSTLSREGVSNFGEIEAFNFFLTKMDKICPNIELIKVRPHPSQNLNSMIEKFKKLDFRIEISREQELVKDLFNSEYIVGCQTYALVVALFCGKKVYSSMPLNAGPSILPFSEIIMLRDL
jgi:hypothetical protein